MYQYLFLVIYIPLSVFLVYSLYQGLFKNKQNKGIYCVFCKIVADRKNTALIGQTLSIIITAIAALLLEWKLVLFCVILNVLSVVILHSIKEFKDRE